MYTFGAPAVSTTPLQDDGACFQGARMFNLDTDSYDPFADLGTWAGYVHPRMQAIQLLPMGSKKTDIYQQVDIYQNYSYTIPDRNPDKSCVIPTYPLGSRGPPVSRNFQVSYDCWDENTPYLPGANYASLSGASTLQCGTVSRALVRIVTNKKLPKPQKGIPLEGPGNYALNRICPYVPLYIYIYIYILMYQGGFWRLLKRITRLAFKDPVPMVQPTLQAHLMSGLRV